MFLKTGATACSVLTDGFVANILASIIKPILREHNDAALELAVSRVIKVALEPGKATL
jgi:hypothetical protein